MGGTTNDPKIRELFLKQFKYQPTILYNESSREAVAQGVTFGGIAHFTNSPYFTTNEVVGFNILLAGVGDVTFTICTDTTRLPYNNTYFFGINSKEGDHFSVPIYEGTHPIGSKNNLLGRVSVVTNKIYKAKQCKLYVTIHITIDHEMNLQFYPEDDATAKTQFDRVLTAIQSAYSPELKKRMYAMEKKEQELQHMNDIKIRYRTYVSEIEKKVTKDEYNKWMKLLNDSDTIKVLLSNNEALFKRRSDLLQNENISKMYENISEQMELAKKKRRLSSLNETDDSTESLSMDEDDELKTENEPNTSMQNTEQNKKDSQEKPKIKETQATNKATSNDNTNNNNNDIDEDGDSGMK